MNWDKETIRKYALEVRDDILNGVISTDMLDMEKVFRANSCGSVGCIAGWMAYKRSVAEGSPISVCTVGTVRSITCEPSLSIAESRALDELFCDFPYLWRRERPEQIARAIQRWADGSTNPWGW